MEPRTFEHALEAAHRRAPFRPFTVELVGGRRVVVDRPDALVVRGGVAVFVDDKGTPTIFDHEGVTAILGEASGDGPRKRKS